MKKYIDPTVKIFICSSEDVIMGSGDNPENNDMLVNGGGLWG